jgi:heat shock transcription factor
MFCDQGFRKIDPERWEFANEDFGKDQKHLLKNIHRRKPIHSHSHPQGSSVDPERAALDEEIERLSQEKAALEANVLRSKQQWSAAKFQFEDLKQQVDNMEQRQNTLLATLEKAFENPTFAEILARKIEDFSAYNKKRRLPQVDHSQPVVENSFLDNLSSSRTEFGNVFHQDFSNKLRLELSPAVSDINMVSRSTQSSNEDGASPKRKLSEGEPKCAQMRTEGFVFPLETLELSDTGASFTRKIDSTVSQKSPMFHPLQPSLTSNEEGDLGHISCHLNLTLASSPMQINRSPYSARMPQVAEEIGKSPDSKTGTNVKESDTIIGFPKSRNPADDTTLSSSQRAPNNNQEPAAAPVRVNDVFWEQFLTERPGCSENEEAISTYRANPYEEQDDGRSGLGISRNAKNMEQLTL